MSYDESLRNKLSTLEDALHNRDLFFTGSCPIPDFQRFLYYADGDNFRRIDFSNARTDDLEALYRACKPAEFGRNGENVLDESYRKAGKMDLTSFSTPFDPRGLGICEQVSKVLLPRNGETYASMDMELYKLNVYGVGDFFRPHKDTPRSQEVFGSLVVVLPTPHAGGELVLRKDRKKWTIDFADKFAAATEPLACFVAFYSDIEHEVLPVKSGYRVTLTYNLYRKPSIMHPSMLSIPTPYHKKLKEALDALVNDESVLPKGGYLGFGLAHEYVHTGHKIVDPLLGQLKGSDRILADVCDALGLGYSLRLLYRGICTPAIENVNLLATNELGMQPYAWVDMDQEAPTRDYLQEALEGLTIKEVEGVDFVSSAAKLETSNLENENWLKPFYKDPVAEVLEVTPMESSIKLTIPYMIYGNYAQVEFYYGTACMLVAVEPVETRKHIGP